METLLHGIVTVEGSFPNFSESNPGSPVHLAILGGSFRSLVARWDLKEVPVRHRFHIREQGGFGLGAMKYPSTRLEPGKSFASSAARIPRAAISGSVSPAAKDSSRLAAGACPLLLSKCPEVDMQDRSSPRFRRTLTVSLNY